MKTNLKKRCARAAFASFLCIALLCVLLLPIGAATAQRPRVFVGGGAFGVRYKTDGILVVGYCDVTTGGRTQNPAKAAGIKPGDCITEINGRPAESAKMLADTINGAVSGTVTVTLRRGEEMRQISLSPLRCDSDGHLRTGLWVRDTGAGCFL